MDDEVDLSAYLSLPNSSARVLLALGRLLLRVVPEEPNAAMERSARRLKDEIDAFMAGLRERRDSGEALQALIEEDLDFATDGLWKTFAQRLEEWRVFERRAFTRFAEGAEQEQFDYQARVEKSERARFLRSYLFGGLGTDFTRMPYLVQAEFIATIWTLIDQEGLESEYAEFVGPQFLTTLRDCHRRYLGMLKDRHTKAKGKRVSFNLNDRRARLQQRLVLYIASVVVLAEEENPESMASISIALEPVDMLRELDEQADGSIAHEGDDEVEVDQLIAEIEAIDVALGVLRGDAVDLALSEVSDSSGSYSKI